MNLEFSWTDKSSLHFLKSLKNMEDGKQAEF